MDQEVAKTLGELELKLQQLEHELTAIGPQDGSPKHPREPDSAHARLGGPVHEPAAVADSGSSQPPPSGRLVDEAIESSQADAILEEDGFAGPPVFGGEELPAQPTHDWKVDVRETAYGEIPSEDPSPSPFAQVAERPGPPIPPPGPTPQPPPPAPPGPPPPEHPPAPIPPSDPQPIDRAELVRFKQRLERTMAELSEELAKLLLPKPPA